MIGNWIYLIYLAVLALVVAATGFLFHINVTAGWAAIFALCAMLGVIGFLFNANTPLYLGPLPFIFCVIAFVSLIVVIARLVG